MPDAIFLDSNLRKANKRFSAIQARESRAFSLAFTHSIGLPGLVLLPDLADRIAAGRARFRYTSELLYLCQTCQRNDKSGIATGRRRLR